jgi:acetyl/propionyl-CoA carboxylase alpha subunit
VHLFERDCSLQRRHQKVIEEAPAPGMDASVRAVICDAAIKAARVVAYEGAGTVEFIADASEGLRADRIWFMEMNTRLQVEHPVTEAITGLDLVEWQLRVASGEPLPLAQEQIVMSGHAVEARLYAEDPSTGFLPSVGALTYFHLPWTVRRDNAVDHGDVVSPYYDPMIAKLIAHGNTRQAAIGDLTEACADVQVWPVKTNAGFLTRLLKDDDFRAGDVDTGLIARRGEGLTAKPAPSADVLAAAAWMRLKVAAPLAERASPWVQASGFRLNAPVRLEVRLEYGGETFAIPGDPAAGEMLGAVYLDGHPIVFKAGETYEFSDPSAVVGAALAGGDGAVRSPMPGKIAAVHVAVGDTVTRGAALVTLEAMKMEHALAAPFDGVVAEVAATLGEQVNEGVMLARVEAQP